jgi:hypothetical protein
MSSIVERVADAIFTALNDTVPGFEDRRQIVAYAAIKAMQNPTADMVDAGQACLDHTPIYLCSQQAKKVWRGMIARALA